MKRYLAAYLMFLYCCSVSMNLMVLQDHAWYTKDLKELDRLYYYISIAHTENINHMSHAGLFIANVGTKSVDVVEPMLEACNTHDVRFKFNRNDDLWLYAKQEEIQEVDKL